MVSAKNQVCQKYRYCKLIKDFSSLNKSVISRRPPEISFASNSANAITDQGNFVD